MKTIIFSDGASSGNPGPSGWAAILIRGQEIQELGGYEKTSTNNRMELMGAICGLEKTDEGDSVTIYTDSQYLVNGITGWIFGWMKNNWRTQKGDEVLNRDLWQRLYGLVEDREVNWKVVWGHAGVIGNNRADEIAVEFSVGNPPVLFHGMVKDYSVPISIPSDEQLNAESSRDRQKSRAYSYLSLVDGVLEKHSTWTECEERVKGKAGAKFRKALSYEDQQKILKEWGVEE